MLKGEEWPTLEKWFKKFETNCYFYHKEGIKEQNPNKILPFELFNGIKVAKRDENRIKANYDVYQEEVDNEQVALKFLKMDIGSLVGSEGVNEFDKNLNEILAEAIELSQHNDPHILNLKEFWIQQVRFKTNSLNKNIKKINIQISDWYGLRG